MEGTNALEHKRAKIKLNFCHEHNRWYVYKEHDADTATILSNEKAMEKHFKNLKRQASTDMETYQHKKLRKATKQRPLLIFDKAFRMFLFITICISLFFQVNADNNDALKMRLQMTNEQDHYVIFDKVGDMASSMAYIHVTFAINISNIMTRAEALKQFINENLHNKDLKQELEKTVIHHMPNQWTGWVAFDHKVGHRTLGSVYHSIFQLAQAKFELVMADLVQLLQKLPPVDHVEIPDYPTRIDNLIGKAQKFKLARPETVFIPGRRRRRSMMLETHFMESSTPVKRATSSPRTTSTSTSSPTPETTEEVFNDDIDKEEEPEEEIIVDFIDVDDNPDALIGTNMERFFQNLETSPDRPKRWAPVFFAIGGALLGTFLGLYNQAEINRLASSIKAANDASNVLVQVSNQHQVELGILQKEIFSLYKVMEHMVRYESNVLEARLDYAIEEIQHHVDQLKSTFQMLQFHRMSSDLVSGPHLTNMHKKVSDMATKNGYKLLPKYPSDYFQLEASYLRNKEDLLVILHVPCVAGAQDLTIYRFVPYPFPLPEVINNNRNTSIAEVFNPETAQPGTSLRSRPKREALYIKPETSFIAVGRGHQYKLLSEAEFGLCNKRSNYYLCEEHQVVRTNLSDTCIGSMFVRSMTGLQDHCKFERRPLQEQVYQLTPTDHLVYSPTMFTTQIICRNGSHFPLHIQDHVRIRVPQGCHTRLERHVISSDVTLRSDPEPLRFEWKWNPLKFPSNLLTDVNIVDEQLGRLERQFELMREFTSSPKYLKPIAETVLEDRHMFNWAWYVVLAAICLMVLLLLAGVYFGWTRRERLSTLCNILGRRTITIPQDEAIPLTDLTAPLEPTMNERIIRRDHSCRDFTTPEVRRSARLSKSYGGSYSSVHRGQREPTPSTSSSIGDAFDLPRP